MARLTARQRLARVHPFVWIGAAALVGGLVAWPLGGWDTVELQSTKIPQVAVGDLVKGQQWSVRVESAQITRVHPDGFSELYRGWTWLRLELEVTNETAKTDSASDFARDFDGIVTLDHGALGFGTTATDPDGRLEVGKPYLISDNDYLPQMQPGLPTRVAIIFDVRDDTWDGDWAVGDDLTVGIIDYTPYESTLGTGIRYGFPTLIAEVTLPIEQGPVS